MIEIEIEDPSWVDADENLEALARISAAAALSKFAASGDVAILLTDDGKLAELNAIFRKQAKPTNVLAFPAGEGADNHLGDIALAFGVCADEAKTQGKSMAAHLQHLVTHGVLHLLGYDHETDAQASEMEGLERVILAGLGVSDPYAAERGEDGQF